MKNKVLYYTGIVGLMLLVGAAIALVESTVVSRGVLVGIGSVFGVGMGLLAFIRTHDKGKDALTRWLWVIGAAVAGFFASASLAVVLNCVTAHIGGMSTERMEVYAVGQETKHYTRRVGRRLVPSGQSSYQVYRAWVIDNRGDTLCTRITAKEYRNLRRGRMIDVRTARGWLGWRVIELAD